MLRARCVILMIAFAACSTRDPSESPDSDADEAASAIYPRPLGTFVAERRLRGDFQQLTLKADGTYHAVKHVTCDTPPCTPVEQDGNYRFADRDTGHYLGLDAGGRDLQVYRYKTRAEWLVLQRSSTDDPWQSLTRSEEAWCGTPRDCEAQGLRRGVCSGEWRCEESACSWACGRLSPVD